MYKVYNLIIFSAYVNLGDPITENVGNSLQLPETPHSVKNSNNERSNQHFVGSITRVNMWSRALDFANEIPTIVQRCQGAPVFIYFFIQCLMIVFRLLWKD